MPFTGFGVLDYDSKHNVSDWLKTLNISNTTVIDNQCLTLRIRCINDVLVLEGVLIYIEKNKLYRIGKTVNSFQEVIRKKIFIGTEFVFYYI